MAYHRILNELLGDWKPRGVIRVSEILEAQLSPLSSPPPGAPKSGQLSSGSWLRSSGGEKKGGGGLLGETGLS